MAISLESFREELLPGLLAIQSSYHRLPAQWDSLFEETERRIMADLAALSPLSLPQALAAGAVAAMIANPVVTRRGIFGWWKA